ncbi:hypothetical protein [Acuticoccus kandeliae]|uniref:hypothetical protein n=1 Tax=Acuticoccus kandeliae TaxID=2073160 RepID=UPI001300B434|nr:hypothetical protein [Acuticoccus kandeliae]
MTDTEKPTLEIRAAIARASGAPEESLAGIAAATAPVVGALPQGRDRAPFGVEPATHLVVLRGARR